MSDAREDPAAEIALPPPPLAFAPAEWLAMGLGGALGALLRAECMRWIPAPDLGLAVPSAAVTFGVNLFGALLLGVLYGRLHVRGGSRLWRPFLGIGVLGSFTTFSTFVAEFSAIGAAQGVAPALLLIVSALILGAAAFAVGDWLAASGVKR